MLDWDDLRFFLTVARGGSVRAAATDLGVSHSTVARRIEALERDIGVRLFDRTPEGYQITPPGQGLLASAQRIDEEVGQIERTLLGQDTRLSGTITVTLPDMAAVHIYMDDFADFCRLYPDISLNIDPSYEIADLARREADVALRLLAHDSAPPEHLIGRELAPVYQTWYASTDYLARIPPERLASEGRWLGWSPDQPVAMQTRGEQPPAPVWSSFPNVLLQVAACRAGLGVASLACIVGDNEPGLVRLPGAPLVSKRSIWLLSHPDLRDTARIRVFREFITERTKAKAARLRGE
jgi:DNA-binding transcriptional LysR family regulator